MTLQFPSPRRMTSFECKKKTHKPLPIGRLGADLKMYLGKISTNASANWEDFDYAVSCISRKLS